MVTEATLEKLADSLIQDFGEPGVTAAANLRKWASADVPLADPRHLETFYRNAPIDLVFDSFWREIPFGTGGRRGPVGFGPNRINRTMVALCVQGHCNYLKKQYPDRQISVVVANDVREFRDIAEVYGDRDDDGVYTSWFGENDNPLFDVTSRSLAVLAAQIYAANGIKVYIESPTDPSAVLTTPELSHAIRELGAQGGVNMSASHNHPDDNGIKVYDANGGQFLPPEDELLAQEMLSPGYTEPVDLHQAIAEGLIEDIPDAVHDDYAKMYVEQYESWCPPLNGSDRPAFVYTPLCGSGLASVGRVLEALGHPFHVPPHQDRDGTFAAIPFRAPNPEVIQATIPAQRYADEIGSNLVISSDPDADRIGVDVRHENEWHHLTGNDIAVVLAYFLMLDPEGPQLQGVTLSTVVTTRMLSAIAREAGATGIVDDLLVGFKYHADAMTKWEESGTFRDIQASTDDLVLAAEESHGVSTSTRVRDKDATPASMYLAYLNARLAENGQTLIDYLNAIRARFPGYAELARSVVLQGSTGVKQINKIMESLRAEPMSEVLGRPVTEITDFWDTAVHGEFKSDTDKVSRNVLRYQAEDVIVIVRPSGTEPKIKAYVHIAPTGQSQPDDEQGDPMAVALDAANDVYRQMLSRIGQSLSDEALLLPDISTLRSKISFDEVVVPQLQVMLDEGWDWDRISARLTQDGRTLTPGSDPLPAMKDSILALLRRWQDEGAHDPSAITALRERLIVL